MNGKRALVETHVYSENNLFQEYSTVHYSKAVYYTFHDSSYFPWSFAKVIVLHSEDVWSRQNQCLTVPFRLYLIVASMMRVGLFLTARPVLLSLIFTFTSDMCFDCFWLLCLRCALLCFWMLRQRCALSLCLTVASVMRAHFAFVMCTLFVCS